MILDEMKNQPEVQEATATLVLGMMKQRAAELGIPVVDTPPVGEPTDDELVGMPHLDDTKTI